MTWTFGPAQLDKMTIEQSDSLKAEREMVKALKARKEALEEVLAKKTEELKRLCYEEGELTGVLPHDTPPLAPGEVVPTFRRRVGTAFSLSVKDKDDKELDTQLSSEFSKLELEVELQGKITSAALRLASDKTVTKYVRKQRRQSYTRAVGKLKEMEKKLGDMRRQMGKPAPDQHHHHHHHHHRHHHRSSTKDDVHRSGGFSSICQASMTPSESYEDQRHRTALSPSHSSPQLSYGATGGDTRGHHSQTAHMDNYDDDDDSPSSTPTYSNLDMLDGATTASSGSSCSKDPSSSSSSHPHPSYHHNHHPLHPHQPHQLYRLDGSHDSGFSSANNMHHVNSTSSSSNSQQARVSSSSPQYGSKDQIQSPALSEPGVASPLQPQYGNDGNYPGRSDRVTYSPDRGHHGTAGGSAAVGDVSYQAENQYSNVSGNIKGSSSNSSIHYGSLDRQQIRNYNSKGYYRDVSPMRFGRDNQGSSNSVGSGSGRDRPAYGNYTTSAGGVSGEHHRYQGGRSDSDVVHPSKVILEVPIHHQGLLQSSPSSSAVASPSPQRSVSRPDLALQGAGGGDSGSSCGSSDVYNASNCYSPRYQEGSAMHKDGTLTHVHHPQHQQMPDGDGNLYIGGHQSSSQSTLQRSMSPNRPQYHHHHHHHPPRSSSPSYASIYPSSHLHHQQQHISPSPSTSSSLSGGGGVVDKMPQPDLYQQHKQMPSPSLSPSPSTSSSSFPRTIPIQRIDSSSASSTTIHSPPPSSPTSLYSPQNSSQSSSPRGPSTPTSHASSSLVTTTNLPHPHMEVTKPYEMSDFYRYSEKLRRQRIIDQYQRQLIGNVEKLSRSSTPQSLEGSDGGHSSHSSSSSSHHLTHHNVLPQSSHYPSMSSYSNMPPPAPPSSTSRGAMLQYGRSASAPLTSLPGQQQQQRLQQQQQYPPPYHHHRQQQQQQLHHCDPITTSSSSSSSYCVKSQGPGNATSHYSYQSSSTYSRVQQIHSVYQSPQPMTCKPVKLPPKHDNNDS